jgi:hypothetical protein
MKPHIVFFFILKLAILIQFALIISNKQTTDSITYITTQVIFKTALFVFIEYIMFQRLITGLEFEDKLIITFAGGLLFYDAWINDFPLLLAQLKQRGFLPKSWALPSRGLPHPRTGP